MPPSAPKQSDLISTLEACYQVEQASDDWLHGVLASLSWLDQGLGVFGFTYVLGAKLALSPGPIVEVGCPPRVREALNIAFQHGPEFNRAAYMHHSVGVASAMPGYMDSPSDLAARERGVFDSWGINGRNWDGQNVVVIANRGAVMAPSAAVEQVMQRVAIHLAAGLRLQQRLQTSEPEAIVSPKGRIEHAVGEARHRQTLRALTSAALAMETARGALRKSQPELAVDAWKARVAARWTLVDRFEHDGKRYLVARENESDVPTTRDLSSRERQVVASAALGRSNKEIAYDLGLAHTTVRVLLARAAKKLGARTRSEVVQQFQNASAAQNDSAPNTKT